MEDDTTIKSTMLFRNGQLVFRKIMPCLAGLALIVTLISMILFSVALNHSVLSPTAPREPPCDAIALSTFLRNIFIQKNHSHSSEPLSITDPDTALRAALGELESSSAASSNAGEAVLGDADAGRCIWRNERLQRCLRLWPRLFRRDIVRDFALPVERLSSATRSADLEIDAACEEFFAAGALDLFASNASDLASSFQFEFWGDSISRHLWAFTHFAFNGSAAENPRRKVKVNFQFSSPILLPSAVAVARHHSRPTSDASSRHGRASFVPASAVPLSDISRILSCPSNETQACLVGNTLNRYGYMGNPSVLFSDSERGNLQQYCSGFAPAVSKCSKEQLAAPLMEVDNDQTSDAWRCVCGFDCYLNNTRTLEPRHLNFLGQYSASSCLNLSETTRRRRRRRSPFLRAMYRCNTRKSYQTVLRIGRDIVGNTQVEDAFNTHDYLSSAASAAGGEENEPFKTGVPPIFWREELLRAVHRHRTQREKSSASSLLLKELFQMPDVVTNSAFPKVLIHTDLWGPHFAAVKLLQNMPARFDHCADRMVDVNLCLAPPATASWRGERPAAADGGGDGDGDGGFVSPPAAHLRHNPTEPTMMSPERTRFGFTNVVEEQLVTEYLDATFRYVLQLSTRRNVHIDLWLDLTGDGDDVRARAVSVVRNQQHRLLHELLRFELLRATGMLPPSGSAAEAAAPLPDSLSPATDRQERYFNRVDADVWKSLTLLNQSTWPRLINGSAGPDVHPAVSLYILRNGERILTTDIHVAARKYIREELLGKGSDRDGLRKMAQLMARSIHTGFFVSDIAERWPELAPETLPRNNNPFAITYDSTHYIPKYVRRLLGVLYAIVRSVDDCNY